MKDVVIVGGGVSGFTTAQELRRLGYAGRLRVVEPQGLPYDRPPLSKNYLDGSLPPGEIFFAGEGWFAEHAVELIEDRVESLDAAAGRVRLSGGSSLDADAVVLATGGNPRSLPIPGGDDPGLLFLRTRTDADRLRAHVGPGRRLVVVGAGLIGAEVASSATKLGTEVTLVDPVAVPGVPALGPTIAAELHAMHGRHGVRALTAPTASIERAGEGWLLRLGQPAADGTETVEADAVLMAVGIAPELSLAVSAGLEVDNGVLVDAGQRTSNPWIYAVGDIARHCLPDGALTLRHEHWDSAMHGAQVAAAAILGHDLPAPAAPWFWTDRHGVHVEATGSMLGGREVVRERDGRPWLAFAVGDDQRLLGAAGIEPGQAIRAARRMIEHGTVIDPEQLADPGVDLKRLARAPKGTDG